MANFQQLQNSQDHKQHNVGMLAYLDKCLSPVIHSKQKTAKSRGIQLESGSPGGGLICETDGDARRLAQACKFWNLVSLRVFWAKRQYFKPPRSRLGFREETKNYAKRNRSQILFFLLFFFFKLSLLGSKFAYARWSPLGVKFKISDEHPRLFLKGVPPRGYIQLNCCRCQFNSVSSYNEAHHYFIYSFVVFLNQLLPISFITQFKIKPQSNSRPQLSEKVGVHFLNSLIFMTRRS